MKNKTYGCLNCRYYKTYYGDYWTPDENECTQDLDNTDTTEEDLRRVWEDCETWEDKTNPICKGYEEKIMTEE